jgi:hypothetical protein
VPLFFSRCKDWSERCTHAMSLATFIDPEAVDSTGSPGAPSNGAATTDTDQVNIYVRLPDGSASPYSHCRVGAMPWPPSLEYVQQIVDRNLGHLKPRRVAGAPDVRCDYYIGQLE